MILTVESFLDSIVFADDEGGAALGVLHIIQFIFVGLGLDKVVDSLRVAVVCSVMERGPLAMVKRVDIGLVLEQNHQTLLAASFACHVERCAMLLILSFKVGAFLDQRLDHSCVILKSSQMQCRLELVRVSIDLVLEDFLFFLGISCG